MVTKRGPLIKAIRKFLSGGLPPENIAPWKNPNNTMKKIIATKVQGRLERGIREAQDNIMRAHVERLIREQREGALGEKEAADRIQQSRQTPAEAPHALL